MLPLAEEIKAQGQEKFEQVSIAQLAGRLDPSLRKPLANYLSEAHSLLATGNIQDPMAPQRGLVVPFGYCTDGEWTWPSYWGYFVREYGVQLPANFIEHARERKFTPSSLSDEELFRAEEEFEEQFFG
ncbi:hypothetical protein [Streptomyces chrestomyceticus]|uniref:Uncharacterized protein n=1 Tax=Streptomyces chrestomyceticus TaxID=68185 RepID=A0ABU7X175_9ACTN